MMIKTEKNKLNAASFNRKQTVSIFLIMLLTITTLLMTVSTNPVYASASSDTQDVYKAKSALVAVGTLKPVQGVDSNIQVMAQKIVNKAVYGVTVKVTWSDNPQIKGTTITYGSTAGSGNVAFTLTKNKAVAYATCPVYVPVKKATTTTAPTTTTTTAPTTTPTTQTTGINVKNFGAAGDGIKNDTTAVQNAINSLKAGQTLYFPSGTYLVNSLRIANPSIILNGSGATIKQSGTGTTDFIIVTANGVTIQNLTIKRDLANAGNLDGVVVRGDNFSMKYAKVDGFYYSIDVSGDYGYIDNVTVQNSGYAGCRLNATSKALNKFTLNNFKVLNSSYKGFVYNGTMGIRDVIVNNFSSIYTGTVKADAMDGFLTDSGESTSVYRIKNLVINTANIQVAGSGAFKILNCETATLNNITINDDRTYSSSRALHSAAKNLYVNGMTANDRIIVFGNADLRNIKYSAATLNFSPLELKGTGTSCKINGFDSSLISNGTNASIRVIRDSGVVHTVTVDNFKGNGNKLFAVINSFTTIKQSLIVGSNVTGYSTTGL